ncbi:MAG TPA: TonB-dependent receptor [Candidatus Kapabacteria bacterium]|nr:TonB-dependent receptor [Candidatus Kapabacteria bacterium]
MALQSFGTLEVKILRGSFEHFQGYSIHLISSSTNSAVGEYEIPDNGLVIIHNIPYGSYSVWLIEGNDVIVASAKTMISSVDPVRIELQMKNTTLHSANGVGGNITDEKTREPVIGASVRIVEVDRATRTNKDGKFMIPNIPDGTYTLFVSAIGYASSKTTVHITGGEAVMNITLRESAIEGEEVVISASPYAGTTGDQYQSAESKTTVELHSSPGSSYAEKISDLPGVSVRGNGSAPSRPILRGMTDNEVLVLENGLRNGDIATYDPAHATPIETESISQIDVVRGPACVMFGPNAIGGLVNIITNAIPTLSSAPFSGILSLGGNSVSDEYTGYFNGVYSAGSSAFGISAGGLHSQDIRIPSGAYTDPASGVGFNLNRMPQSFNHTSEFGLGYSLQGDFGMIGIGYTYYEMNYGIPGVPPNSGWDTVPPATSRIWQIKNTLELRSIFSVESSFLKQIRFNANYNDYGHSEFPTAEDSSGVSDPQANHFHKQSVNAVLQFQHQLSNDFRGTFGLWGNVENLTIEGDQPLGPNSRTTDLAGYLFEEYITGDNTRLQAGLRFDYDHIQTQPFVGSTDSIFQTLNVAKSNNAFTASLGVIQKVSDNLTASLNIGRSFRSPTVQELYANGLDAASGTYSLGDVNLSPETGFGLDASLKGNFDNLSFEISPYINFINNFIYGFLPGSDSMGFPIRQFSETDARLMGFETSLNVQLARNFAVRASVDYVNAEQTKDTIQPLPFIPPLKGLLRLKYEDNMYSGVIEWRVAASQARLGVRETPTAGYGIVNIGGGIRFYQNSAVHTISLHIDNLFNQLYRDNLSVIKDFIPQPARGFRLMYDLLF